jgi:hypothetical protein
VATNAVIRARAQPLGAVDPKEATMLITIDCVERAVLHAALTDDIPSIEDVLLAHEDVDQEHAEQLRLRLSYELLLLDRLGWRADSERERFELGGSELLATFAGGQLGLDVVSVRPSAIWGPGGRPSSTFFPLPALVHAAARGDLEAAGVPEPLYAQDGATCAPSRTAAAQSR